jgi:hypothetical protein
MDYRGLEDLLTSSAELRVALGLESVPDHSTFHWFMATTLRLFRRRSRRGDGSRGCHGLFPVSGQPLLHETSSEAVPDVVDGRVGPTPGHLCPEGLGRSREPVSVASAVGPGDGASWSRPASVALCRLRFRADSSTAPGGAGYREHHPGHGVLSWTGPDPYRRRTQRYFPRRKYGRRWIAETVASVLKRRFGEALATRRWWQQVKQALLRGLVYNLRRTVVVAGIFSRLWVHCLLPVGRRTLEMLTASPLP